MRGGERTRIYRQFWTFARTVRFTAMPLSGAGEASGLIEVERTMLVFWRRPARTRPLAADNAVERGLLDDEVSNYVTPDRDTEIGLQRPGYTRKDLVLALGLLVLLAALGLLVPLLLGGSGRSTRIRRASPQGGAYEKRDREAGRTDPHPAYPIG